MGGSIGDGNATVSAEFNIYADPEAAAIVFGFGLPITMMGLDVTHQAVLYPPASARLRELGTRSGAIGAELADYALSREGQWYGTPRMSVHDAVAVAHLAIPDLVEVADYSVQVDTGRGPARGRTVCDGLARRAERQGLTMNAQVGIQIDRDRFEDLLVDAYSRLP
jgi:inosine-uridine nucleoside N-ribohydrolase